MNSLQLHISRNSKQNLEGAHDVTGLQARQAGKAEQFQRRPPQPISRFRGYALCPDCRGTRLRAEARAVRIAGRSITEVCQMTVKEARPFFAGLSLTAAETQISDKVLEEIEGRSRFLDEVGLDYLTLDRLTSPLSMIKSRS